MPSQLPDFVANARTLQCAAVHAEHGDQTVEDVVQVTDSTFAALYARDRLIILYDAALRPIRSWRFDQAGPRGLARPDGFALLNDSMVYVTDRGNLNIRLFAPTGDPHWTIGTDFLPHQLTLIGGKLVVSAFVSGLHRKALHVVDGDSLVDLQLPLATLPDKGLESLANMFELTSRADGSLVIAHSFLVPRLHVRTAGGRIETRTLAVPDEAAKSVRYVPDMPLSERDILLVYINVLSAASSPGGEYLYLTRTGRLEEDRPQKALIRLNRDFEFVKAYLLPDAKIDHLAWLNRGTTVVLTVEDGPWLTCPLPS